MGLSSARNHLELLGYQVQPLLLASDSRDYKKLAKKPKLKVLKGKSALIAPLYLNKAMVGFVRVDKKAPLVNQDLVQIEEILKMY